MQPTRTTPIESESPKDADKSSRESNFQRLFTSKRNDPKGILGKNTARHTVQTSWRYFDLLIDGVLDQEPNLINNIFLCRVCLHLFVLLPPARAFDQVHTDLRFAGIHHFWGYQNETQAERKTRYLKFATKCKQEPITTQISSIGLTKEVLLPKYSGSHSGKYRKHRCIHGTYPAPCLKSGPILPSVKAKVEPDLQQTQSELPDIHFPNWIPVRLISMTKAILDFTRDPANPYFIPSRVVQLVEICRDSIIDQSRISERLSLPTDTELYLVTKSGHQKQLDANSRVFQVDVHKFWRECEFLDFEDDDGAELQKILLDFRALPEMAEIMVISSLVHKWNKLPPAVLAWLKGVDPPSNSSRQRHLPETPSSSVSRTKTPASLKETKESYSPLLKSNGVPCNSEETQAHGDDEGCFPKPKLSYSAKQDHTPLANLGQPIVGSNEPSKRSTSSFQPHPYREAKLSGLEFEMALLGKRQPATATKEQQLVSSPNSDCQTKLCRPRAIDDDRMSSQGDSKSEASGKPEQTGHAASTTKVTQQASSKDASIFGGSPLDFRSRQKFRRTSASGAIESISHITE